MHPVTLHGLSVCLFPACWREHASLTPHSLHACFTVVTCALLSQLGQPEEVQCYVPSGHVCLAASDVGFVCLTASDVGFVKY